MLELFFFPLVDLLQPLIDKQRRPRPIDRQKSQNVLELLRSEKPCSDMGKVTFPVRCIHVCHDFRRDSTIPERATQNAHVIFGAYGACGGSGIAVEKQL